MTTRHFYILSCAVLGLLIAPATAYATSQITVPWQCSFEAEEDLSDWVFNQNSATATDQWVIGDATRSDGHQSLYISTDGGENAMSGAKQNVVMAYRKVHFPEHASGTKIMTYPSIGRLWGLRPKVVHSMCFSVTIRS